MGADTLSRGRSTHVGKPITSSQHGRHEGLVSAMALRARRGRLAIRAVAAAIPSWTSTTSERHDRRRTDGRGTSLDELSLLDPTAPVAAPLRDMLKTSRLK